MSRTYQGGPACEVFTPAGTDPLRRQDVSVKGRVKRAFDKQAKGYALVCDGGVTTKVELPNPKARKGLGLTQRFLALQLALPSSGEAFSLELTVSDSERSRRRLVISSGFRTIVANPLHVQLPLAYGLDATQSMTEASDYLVPRGQWFTFCVDLQDMISWNFRGINFRTLEAITVSGHCKLRKVFTLKDPPSDVASALDPMRAKTAKPIPRAHCFPAGLDPPPPCLLYCMRDVEDWVQSHARLHEGELPAMEQARRTKRVTSSFAPPTLGRGGKEEPSPAAAKRHPPPRKAPLGSARSARSAFPSPGGRSTDERVESSHGLRPGTPDSHRSGRLPPAVSAARPDFERGPRLAAQSPGAQSHRPPSARSRPGSARSRPSSSASRHSARGHKVHDQVEEGELEQASRASRPCSARSEKSESARSPPQRLLPALMRARQRRGGGDEDGGGAAGAQADPPPPYPETDSSSDEEVAVERGRYSDNEPSEDNNEEQPQLEEQVERGRYSDDEGEEEGEGEEEYHAEEPQQAVLDERIASPKSCRHEMEVDDEAVERGRFSDDEEDNGGGGGGGGGGEAENLEVDQAAAPLATDELDIRGAELAEDDAISLGDRSGANLDDDDDSDLGLSMTATEFGGTMTSLEPTAPAAKSVEDPLKAMTADFVQASINCALQQPDVFFEDESAADAAPKAPDQKAQSDAAADHELEVHRELENDEAQQQAAAGEGGGEGEEEEELDLIYDPILDCYYCPKTNKYYKRK